MPEARAEPDDLDISWPVPESDDLGRYLEDTITVDWQTPLVMERASALIADRAAPEDRLRALFRFVRDEIDDAMDVRPERVACSASQVLREGQGLSYAKSHLLAGMLRYAGFPTGFCYARLRSGEGDGGLRLHGFNAVFWQDPARWLFLDASGREGAPEAAVRFAPPWALSFVIDPAKGESLLPEILRRPGKRVVDLLERAPDFDAVVRNLPDVL